MIEWHIKSSMDSMVKKASNLKASSHKVVKLIHPSINSHVVHSKTSHLSEYLTVMPHFKSELNLQNASC